MSKFTRDTEVIAYCYFGPMAQVSLRFQRPHIIHPRMRASLDELTAAGWLERIDDRRGPITWKLKIEFASLAGKFAAPKKGESFPMTLEGSSNG